MIAFTPPLALLRLAAGACLFVGWFSYSASAQGAEIPDPCTPLIRAWVDPVFGVDGPGIVTSTSPFGFFAQVNDATTPFKTLQAAIDAVESHVITAFNAGAPLSEGLVYAMPGLYGPGGNGEHFPVQVRDRVHLQGQGARGCVLRGLGIPLTFTPTTYAMPTIPGAPAIPGLVEEVLVDFSNSSKFSQVFGTLPWIGLEETSEMLDGFTFQGGEVQVLFHRQPGGIPGAPELRGRISNCLFDMRHDWPVTSQGPIVPGPLFGIQMAKVVSLADLGNQSCPPTGYPDQLVLIANNTFVMAELRIDAELGLVSDFSARDQAVAIIDVTDPACNLAPAPPDASPRGLGNPIIVNNLFRTVPNFGSVLSRPFAMLGIDGGDTSVGTSFTPPRPCNAFSSALVGSASNGFSNGHFISTPVAGVSVGLGRSFPAFGFPVPLLDCHTPPLVACGVTGTLGCPTLLCCALPPAVAACAPQATNPDPLPIVEIFFDPTVNPAAVDPVFVGEFLAPTLATPPSRYRDWRILPGSPLVDMGVKPEPLFQPSGAPSLQTNLPGWVYQEPACEELRSFDWDHEGYGNPRVVGSSVDIGFDEFQMFIMSGSYANDSNSHNVSGFLNPTPEPGRPQRTMIIAPLTGGATQVLVHGANANVIAPPPSPAAWTIPPLTTRVINSNLPVGFQTRWISFRDDPATGTPTPWNSTNAALFWTSQVTYPLPWTTQVVVFARLIVPGDNEPSGSPTNPTAYFGTQAVIHAGQPDTHPYQWSNLQYEYR